MKKVYDEIGFNKLKDFVPGQRSEYVKDFFQNTYNMSYRLTRMLVNGPENSYDWHRCLAEQYAYAIIKANMDFLQVETDDPLLYNQLSDYDRGVVDGINKARISLKQLYVVPPGVA